MKNMTLYKVRMDKQNLQTTIKRGDVFWLAKVYYGTDSQNKGLIELKNYRENTALTINTGSGENYDDKKVLM
jgi:hypothetical protein